MLVSSSQVQGITSLTIGEEGNPLYAKNWRPYAIFRLPDSVGDRKKCFHPRLEHWGLLYVNNQEVGNLKIHALLVSEQKPLRIGFR